VVGNLNHGEGRGYHKKMSSEPMNATEETNNLRNFRKPPATKKGRCRLHGGASGSGGPPGRNGQYRHGERTKTAIAEQRKLSALLKMLRAGLT